MMTADELLIQGKLLELLDQCTQEDIIKGLELIDFERLEEALIFTDWIVE